MVSSFTLLLFEIEKQVLHKRLVVSNCNLLCHPRIECFFSGGKLYLTNSFTAFMFKYDFQYVAATAAAYMVQSGGPISHTLRSILQSKCSSVSGVDMRPYISPEKKTI